MIVKEEINSYFLNLLENKELAVAHFYGKDISEYNKNRLAELQSTLETEKELYNIMASLLSVTRFFKIDNLVDIASKVEKQNQRVESSIRALSIFEFDLAFLIFLGILDVEKAKKLGFDKEYINELLANFKMSETSYNKYYFDERTGKTAQITKSGVIVLPYTPDAVSDAIKEKYCKRRHLDLYRVDTFY